MSSANQSFRGSPYAQEFISHLQPYSTTYKAGRGEQFDLQVNGQGMCYLLLEGTIAFYRRNDGMMLTTAQPGHFRPCEHDGYLFQRLF